MVSIEHSSGCLGEVTATCVYLERKAVCLSLANTNTSHTKPLTVFPCIYVGGFLVVYVVCVLFLIRYVVLEGSFVSSN